MALTWPGSAATMSGLSGVGVGRRGRLGRRRREFLGLARGGGLPDLLDQHLRRQLQAEGTSYQAVLTGTRE